MLPENKWNISLKRFSAARLASFKDAVENLHRGWPFVRCLHLLARGVGDIPSQLRVLQKLEHGFGERFRTFGHQEMFIWLSLYALCRLRRGHDGNTHSHKL